MADDETTVKLLIEAEDRTRDAFEQAKKRTEELKKLETELWKQVNDSQKTANTSGKEWLALRHQAVQTGEKLQRSYGTQAAALHQLVTAHTAVTAAVQKFGQHTQGAFTGASAAVLQYLKHFVAVTAVIETARRSMEAFANTERGMNRIALETGSTAKQVEHLGHQFTRLSGLTGRSMEELQSSFRSFRDQAGTSLHQTEELFEAVTVAAHAAGVESESLGRVALVTMRDLKIPMTEMYGYLDMLVKNVPATMIASWGQVAPKITDMMHNMGFTGKENAELLTSTFTHLAQTLGSTERAAQGMTNIFSKAQDISTNLGKMMVPEIERIQKADGDATDVAEKMLERLTKLGADDPSLTKRSMVQKMIGVTPQDMEALKATVEHTRMLKEISRETGENVGTVAKRLGVLGTDSKTSLDIVSASFKNILESVGKLLDIVGLPNALSKLMDSTATDLENIVSLLKWISEHVPGFMGTTKPGAKPGEPATSTPKGIIDILRGKTDAEKAEEAAQKRAEEAKKRWEERNKGRPTPSNAPRPGFGPDGRRLPGYATGGEFEVPGRAGGGDTEQVGFMASPGEKVAVTTPMAESLQVQQDKADIASREHFARFHGTAFTKTTGASWWPAGGVRDPSGASGGGMGGLPSMGSSPGGGSGPGGGGNNKSGDSKTNSNTETPGTGTTPLKTPVGTDEKSDTGPAEDIETAVKRGYLTQAGATAGGNTSLAAQRVRFATEIASNPALKEKILRISAGENLDNNANRAVFESAMNRAAMMGTTLAHEMRRTNEGGYYAGYKGDMSAADRKIAEANLAAALGGSNVSNYATENASGSWGEKRMSGGMFTKVYQSGAKGNVELFGIPTGPGARGYDRYAKWKADAEKGQQANVPVQAGGTTVGTASSVLAGVRQGQTVDAEGKVKESTGEYGPPGVGEPKLLGDSKGVHPELYAVVKEASRSLPEGYTARILNGKEARTRGGEHPKGQAADVKIYGPDGKPVGGDEGWYQNPAAFRTYEQFAQRAKEAQVKMYPGGPGFQWGGYFVNKGPGSYGFADAMHMQRGGPAAGGTWEGGAQGPVLEWLKKGGGTSIGIGGKVATTGANSISVKTASTPAQREAEAKKLVEIEQRAAETYKKAQERQAGTTTTTVTADNKPATAPTNTKVATASPADGRKSEEKAAGKNLGASDPGGEKAAGKNLGGGAAASASTPHPVSPQADPIPGKQWGGSVRGGRPYMVGESGPEMFTPAGPGQITPGAMDVGSMMGQYRQFAEMLRSPIMPNIQMPRAGPMRQRMGRRVEQQRERDVGMMTRHASHSDIGFS